MTDTVKPTLVTFLLDRSSSMGAIWDDTIDGFNAYLASLQSGGGEAIKFTRLQFDFHNGVEIHKDCVAEIVSKVDRLSKANYQPRGSTPLIDAAYQTIEAVESSLASYDTKPQVIVCIQTDGQENSSCEHSWDQLKALITSKTEQGWVFNFMGTGIDAYAHGAQMGIAAANTMSTGTSRDHVTASYAAMADSNMRYARSGLTASAAFTMAERASSGDCHARNPSLLGGVPLGAAVHPSVTGRLDLTTGAAHGPSKSKSSRLDLAR